MAGRHSFDALTSGDVAIDGGGGRKDDSVYAEILHATEEVDSTAEIVMVIHDGFFDRLGDGFEAGKMYDEIKLMIFENFFDGAKIGKIDVVESGGFTGEFLDVFDGGGFAIDEIVDDDDAMATL